jgi:hypothetical protein
MDFFQDLRDEVVKALPHDPKDRAALTALSDGELLGWLFNWLDRLVLAQPRVVLESLEFKAASLPADAAKDLQQLIGKIARGDELSPHLSRSVREGFKPPPSTSAKAKLSKRADLDLLLNDWGIHHLHLSQEFELDGFVKRGELVLLAVFTPDTANLLDVLPHGNWTNQHLVEVAVRNWPDAGLFYSLGEGVRLVTPIDQFDRKEIRSVGINSPVEVDGRVYLSRGVGITSVGTSVRSTRRALNLLDTLDDVVEKLKQNPEYLRPNIEQSGKKYPVDPDFQLVLCRGRSDFGFAIKEKKTGVFIPIAA